MNPKWPLWIAGSVNKHFTTELSPVTVVFVEGDHRSKDVVDVKEVVEIRMDGPYVKQLSPSLWRLTYEINILIQRQMDDQNAYAIWKTIGQVVQAMTKPIQIFDYESGNVNPVFQSCLNVFDDKGDVNVHYFGQIEPNTKKVMATAEAHYYTELGG